MVAMPVRCILGELIEELVLQWVPGVTWFLVRDSRPFLAPLNSYLE